MFSDDEIKGMPGGTFTRPGDEIISIREVCLDDKFDKKDFGFKSEQLLPSSGRNDLDVSRSLFRDGFFSENYDQARFVWTEEDGNIAALISESGFGTTSHTTFGKELEAALQSEIKEADTSSSFSMLSNNSMSAMDLSHRSYSEPQIVSSTSAGNGTDSSIVMERSKPARANCKVDKADPRTRFHYVKYLNRQGRTVKLWECGICSREFQHQYTLMRHLPTHTDERNFHCDSCGKSFRQLSTLSQHRAIHSAERPYACKVCNKTFNRVSTLISHRKTHSDQKPYKCHICPKGFHQKGNLRNHLFTHTNERPYRCNVCHKGFNQQSNLVCHKTKAHPDDSCGITIPDEIAPRKKNTPCIIRAGAESESQPDSTISSAEQCEVTSSVGPYLPTMEGPSSSNWTLKPISSGPCKSDWTISGSGVIVEPIKTYHMGVALATRQTPFALLRPDQGPPVLVKVVDTKLPGGEQMLVPATAEDLRMGGKIVMNNEGNSTPNNLAHEETDRAVQIRVPVVATVVPKIKPGGRLHLVVEEPHHAYTSLFANIGEVRLEPCTLRESREVDSEQLQTHTRPEVLRRLDAVCLPPPIAPCPEMRPVGEVCVEMSTLQEPREQQSHTRPEVLCRLDAVSLPPPVVSFSEMRPGTSTPLSLSPPDPSPPLDLIWLDLFEPMGPQITAASMESIDQVPSDDSNIFIGEFEEIIALSDSD